MIDNRIFAKTRAALQSRKPFEECYLEFADCVYWYLLLRVSNPQVAQDLTSQTFLKAYQAYADLRKSERFAPWIFRIARNLSIDYYRRAQSPEHSALELSEDLVSHGPDLLDSAMQSERASAIQMAIRALPRADQDLLSLRFVAQLTFKEIAGLLNWNESTTKTAFYKLMASLKTQLEEK